MLEEKKMSSNVEDIDVSKKKKKILFIFLLVNFVVKS